MNEDFLKYIDNQKIFSVEDKIVIGISGGADSVALASLLHRFKYNISLAHCNFKLRGEESDQDELFVRKFAEELGVDVYCESFQTESFCKENKISIQMGARKLRYDWFEKIRIATKSNYIAIAHHRDDNIETFLINLIRGSGIRGFLGMKEQRDKIIRPLLSFSRQDIESYLKDINQDYRLDSTNRDIKYLRNNIRHNLIPVFQKINPSFEKSIINQIDYLNDVFKLYADQIKNHKRSLVSYKDDTLLIDKNKLLKIDYQDIILREVLNGFGFTQIDKIMQTCETSRNGKIFFSDTHRLLIDRDHLIVAKTNKNISKEYMIQEDIYELDEPINLEFSFSEKINYNADINIAELDASKLSFPLKIRRWKHGDYFYPLGMNKKKKVSDFFIDNKFSLFDKENVWLLCSKNDIVWVIGSRIDERFKISDQTKKAYIAKLV